MSSCSTSSVYRERKSHECRIPRSDRRSAVFSSITTGANADAASLIPAKTCKAMDVKVTKSKGKAVRGLIKSVSSLRV
jgi:hypothetical protein